MYFVFYLHTVHMCIALDSLYVPVHVFMFRQETCDNDDDFTVGWRDELPPGVQGCLRPQRPPNSFLRVMTNPPACT